MTMPVFQHLVIVFGVVGRQAEREREQAGRLRGKFEPVGVRAANDQGQRIERRVVMS